jgi:ubiquinol-cytochrome c reductase cytochrome b subunit
VIRRAVRFLDSRTGTAPRLRRALRYVFPDHWSFLLGEIALYSFLVLLATGVYLTLFFEPSLERTTYAGAYEPLRGREVSHAYDSALRLSFDVDAGLLIRQTHHWAALVFVVAIVLHLARVFFTGAFRRPRDLTYYVGLTILALAIVEGFTGYSLLDDLLSGMGLVIAYSVVASLPLIGGNLATLIWAGEFPGGDAFMSRLYIAHVLLLPVAIGGLLALHLTLVALTKHSQFPSRRRTERNVVGTPLWPGYALRSTSLALAVAAVLVLLGGLVQVNPVWQWGPYEPWQSTNGAQPDWYLGWLIGALRLMPGFDVTVFDWTLAPNPFFGGVLFPLCVFGFLYLWPWLERRRTGDRREHHLLDRPRDAPWRTAIGVAFFTWVAVVFAFGAADRVFLELGIPYRGQLWAFRVLVFALPPLTGWIALRVCRELQATRAGAV